MDVYEEFRGSSRLHWFLFAFRMLSLIVGLALTDFNKPGVTPYLFAIPVIPGTGTGPMLTVTFFLFFYHLAAGAYSFKAHEKSLQPIS